MLWAIGAAYIYLSSNSSRDTAFYYEVANNIVSGCGFSLDTPSGCQPLAGGYFPGYPTVLSIALLANFKDPKMICICVYSLQILASLRLSKTIDMTKIVGTKSSTIAFAWIAISPLRFGFSRFALIEPCLAVISTVLVNEYLLSTVKQRSVLSWTSITCLTLGIYFKPTFVITLPILAMLEIASKPKSLRKDWQRIFCSTLVVAALASPWMYRQASLNANNLSMYSNRVPPGFEEYRRWTRFITVTEYDHAAYHFSPGNNHDKDGRLKLPRLNPWVSYSDEDYRLVNDILRPGHQAGKVGFNAEEAATLTKAANMRKGKTNAFQMTTLNALQSTSLLFHPLNSWGFPLEISGLTEKLKTADGRAFQANHLALPLIGKLLLWIYRVFVAAVYVYRFSRDRAIPTTAPQKVRCTFDMLFNAGLAITVLHMILYVVLFSQLEHRYFSPLTIWVELGPILYVLRLREDDLKHRQSQDDLRIQY